MNGPDVLKRALQVVNAAIQVELPQQPLLLTEVFVILMALLGSSLNEVFSTDFNQQLVTDASSQGNVNTRNYFLPPMLSPDMALHIFSNNISSNTVMTVQMLSKLTHYNDSLSSSLDEQKSPETIPLSQKLKVHSDCYLGIPGLLASMGYQAPPRKGSSSSPTGTEMVRRVLIRIGTVHV